MERNRKGFTIVELVIVIAVIAILATTLVPTFGNVIQNAKDAAAKQEAKNVYTSYMVEHPELAGSLFVYQTDGRYVAIQNGAPVGIYGTQGEACTALGLAEDAKLSDTGDGKLLISGDAPITPNEPTEPQKESIAGKKISFMGDSISTFEGWSNNGEHNSTIADNRVMYNQSGSAKYQNLVNVDETWWMRTVNKLGLELCVNNSYSGSRVTSGPSSYPDEVGCGDRAINLHNDHTGTDPDIIVIYMGTNDYQQIGGTVSVDAFARDYAKMVEKIKNRYPEADVYLCTLYHYDHVKAGKAIAPSAYNAKIESIAATYDCNVVDFYNGTGVTPDNLEYYTVDLLIDSTDISLVHPNAAGMGKMYECLKTALAKNYTIEEVEKESYSVTVDCDPSVAVGAYPSAVTEGEAVEVSLGGFASKVTVTMNGCKIDCYDSASGKIIIPYVTGDVVITATPADWVQHLNHLPADINGTTDLYKMPGLKTRIGYYTANNIWDPKRTDVVSAIFSVSEGMQIKSSSFVHVSGQNKGTIITWFMQDGTMQTVKQEYVYEQQTTIGYVTVPEGVIAVNMVWRIGCETGDQCEDNYMFIVIPGQD